MAEVHEFMAPRYAEGYTKGVHDEDALRILGAMLPLHLALGLLRYGPRVRSLAMLFWENYRGTDDGARLGSLVAAHGSMRRFFSAPDAEIHPLRSSLERGLCAPYRVVPSYRVVRLRRRSRPYAMHSVEKVAARAAAPIGRSDQRCANANRAGPSAQEMNGRFSAALTQA